MGSRGYGLERPESDYDYRGVYIHEDMHNLIGMGRHDHDQKQQGDTDQVYNEFRHNLNLLYKGNTQSLELLFNENWIEITDEWKHVQKNRNKLVDSERIFSCLRGYMQGELSLANGARKGVIGGKRAAMVEKFGFSPSNFVNLFRLAFCGITFFEKGHFPVNIKEEEKLTWEFLMAIKMRPENQSKENLNDIAGVYEKHLVSAYEARKETRVFDREFADKLCLDIYGPLIQKLIDNSQK